MVATPGERLQIARKEKGYTQTDLANIIGYVTESISRIETSWVSYNKALTEKLLKAGINGYAIEHGIDQKENDETIILVGKKPININGYTIDTDNFTIERSKIVKGIQSCFKYKGEDYGNIKTGDMLYLDHHRTPSTSEVVVVKTDDGYTLAKVMSRKNGVLSIENENIKLDYNTKERKPSWLIGTVKYILSEAKGVI